VIQAAVLAWGQERGDPTRDPREERTRYSDPRLEGSNPATVVVASREDYRIGASDVLSIKVLDSPELDGNFVVSAKGMIPMNYLGDLRVVDMTPVEVARLIENGLRPDYLKDPRVTVTVAQYNSKSFFIQGCVKSPGVYKIMGRVSLFKLINIAGGLTENHGSNAFIIREKRTNGGDVPTEAEDYEFIRANVSKMREGDLSENPFVEPGDLINIPLAGVFYVNGEVNRPGAFTLRENTSLRQAITLAQGTTFAAAKDRTVIFRDEKGVTVELKIDLDKVMKGKAGDVAIQKDDVILVPNSKAKSIGGALLRGFTMTNASRVIVPY
jgi:polysaccharide export outer membrane protein